MSRLYTLHNVPGIRSVTLATEFDRDIDIACPSMLIYEFEFIEELLQTQNPSYKPDHLKLYQHHLERFQLENIIIDHKDFVSFILRTHQFVREEIRAERMSRNVE